jgi:hypothetical protein
MDQTTLTELDETLQDAKRNIGTLLNEARLLMGTHGISKQGHLAWTKIHYVQDKLTDLYGEKETLDKSMGG